MPIIPVRVRRSNTAGSVPPTNLSKAYTLVHNPVDGLLWAHDGNGVPVRINAVSLFKTTASYPAGAMVSYLGRLYRSLVPVSPGSFDGSKWTSAGLATAFVQESAPLLVAGIADDGFLWYKASTAELKMSSNGAWVNISASDRVARSGDTMTGHLGLPPTPGSTQAVRRDWVEALVNPISTAISDAISSIQALTSAALMKAGGTMTGPLNVLDPASATEPATLQRLADYVTISDNAPVSANTLLWFRSDIGRLFIRYGTAWVDVGPAANVDPLIFLQLAIGGTITGPVIATGGLKLDHPDFSWKDLAVPAVKTQIQENTTGATNWVADPRTGKFEMFGRVTLTSAASSYVITFPYRLKQGYFASSQRTGLGASVLATTTGGDLVCEYMTVDDMRVRWDNPAAGGSCTSSYHIVGFLKTPSEVVA